MTDEGLAALGPFPPAPAKPPPPQTLKLAQRRFRDQRDRWPELGARLPAPLPGPHGQALAVLRECVPSLDEELIEHVPDLFEPEDV